MPIEDMLDYFFRMMNSNLELAIRVFKSRNPYTYKKILRLPISSSNSHYNIFKQIGLFLTLLVLFFMIDREDYNYFLKKLNIKMLKYKKADLFYDFEDDNFFTGAVKIKKKDLELESRGTPDYELLRELDKVLPPLPSNISIEKLKIGGDFNDMVEDVNKNLFDIMKEYKDHIILGKKTLQFKISDVLIPLSLENIEKLKAKGLI